MVYVRIRENSAQAKALLSLLKTLPFVEIIEKEDIPNNITMNAMYHAENNMLTKARNSKDLIVRLRK